MTISDARDPTMSAQEFVNKCRKYKQLIQDNPMTFLIWMHYETNCILRRAGAGEQTYQDFLECLDDAVFMMDADISTRTGVFADDKQVRLCLPDMKGDYHE